MWNIDKSLFIKMWDYLLQIADRKEIETYSDVAKNLNLGNPQIVGKILWPIQDYCLENQIPALTSIIVSKVTWYPWDGFIERGWKDLSQMQEDVFNYNWDEVDFALYVDLNTFSF